MVAVELRTREPIIALRLLGNRLFRSGNVVMALVSVSFFGTLFAISLYYQDGRGLSALGSGLSTFPEAVGVMAGAQLASRILYPRLGPRRHITIGLVTVSVVTALISTLGASASLWWARLLMFALGPRHGPRCSSPPRRHRSPPSQPKPPAGLDPVQRRPPAGGRCGRGPAYHRHRACRAHPPGRRPCRRPVLAYRVAFLVAAAFSLCATVGSLAIRTPRRPRRW